MNLTFMDGYHKPFDFELSQEEYDEVMRARDRFKDGVQSHYSMFDLRDNLYDIAVGEYLDDNNLLGLFTELNIYLHTILDGKTVAKHNVDNAIVGGLFYYLRDNIGKDNFFVKAIHIYLPVTKIQKYTWTLLSIIISMEYSRPRMVLKGV